jgi:hypothetical protein
MGHGLETHALKQCNSMSWLIDILDIYFCDGSDAFKFRYICIVFFYVKKPCSLVRGCHHFGGTCYLHLQGIRWEQHVPPDLTRLHAVKTHNTVQKTNLLFFRGVRKIATSKLFVTPVRLSIRSRGTISPPPPPLDGFSWNFIFGRGGLLKSVEKIQLWLKSDENNRCFG